MKICVTKSVLKQNFLFLSFFKRIEELLTNDFKIIFPYIHTLIHPASQPPYIELHKDTYLDQTFVRLWWAFLLVRPSPWPPFLIWPATPVLAKYAIYVCWLSTHPSHFILLPPTFKSKLLVYIQQQYFWFILEKFPLLDEFF